MESAAISAGNGRQAVGILEDNDYVSGLVHGAFEDEGFVPVRFDSLDNALRLAREGMTVFILDIKIGSRSLGLDVLEDLKEVNPNIWVCIYSGHVGSEDQVMRARKAGADFVQVKTGEPKRDLMTILRELYLYRRQLYSFAAAIMDGRLKSSSDYQLSIRDEVHSNPLEAAFMPHFADGRIASGHLTLDENSALYYQLIQNSEWRSTFAGKVVAIVDGLLVCSGNSLREVLEVVRRDHADKNRFVTSIELSEDVFEVPTPFQLED